MEKVYDPATGHEVRELTGKNAGQKYLVDSSGVYAGLYGSGGFNVTPISYDTTGITPASGSGTDTGITPSVSGTRYNPCLGDRYRYNPYLCLGDRYRYTIWRTRGFYS